MYVFKQIITQQKKNGIGTESLISQNILFANMFILVSFMRNFILLLLRIIIAYI